MTIVLDTETTGLAKCTLPFDKPTSLSKMGSEVVQLGGLIIKEDDRFEPFLFFCDTIAPNLNKGAQKVTGLDMNLIRPHVPCYYLHQAICEGVPELMLQDLNIIGHNIKYDYQMMKQSLRNSIDFNATLLTNSLMPTNGRWLIDTIELTQVRGRWQKLQSLASKYKTDIDNFIADLSNTSIRTNSPSLCRTFGIHAHNALYDSICTWIVWRNEIWKKKVF